MKGVVLIARCIRLPTSARTRLRFKKALFLIFFAEKERIKLVNKKLTDFAAHVTEAEAYEKANDRYMKEKKMKEEEEERAKLKQDSAVSLMKKNSKSSGKKRLN